MEEKLGTIEKILSQILEVQKEMLAVVKAQMEEAARQGKERQDRARANLEKLTAQLPPHFKPMIDSLLRS